MRPVRVFGPLLLFVSGMLALPAVCPAQAVPATPVLVTDRPGFGESSAVVGRGTIQIETGVTVEQTDRDLRRVMAPQVLARVGITRDVELRLATDGVIAQSTHTAAGREHARGFSDAELGAKVHLLDAARAGVDLAVIPYVSLPTAAAGFGSSHYDAGFKIAGGREVAGAYGVSGTFNAASARADGVRAWQREISVSVDHALRGAVAAYGEIDGAFAGAGCACSIDGGLTIGVGSHGQFDVEAGRGVIGEAEHWFVGVGYVLRHLRR